MLDIQTTYSLNDVSIVQAPVSDIEHRSECNPYDINGMLPIFTAPMPCVVDRNTIDKYKNAKINPILPRSEDYDYRVESLLKGDYFVAFSLDEFIKITMKSDVIENNDVNVKILIDIANGNMSKLHDAIKFAKNRFGDKIIIMSGNVASPESYVALSKAGCDYVRCSVGSGTGCNTTTYTGIYYPMASLLNLCYANKKLYGLKSKIIADGGLSEYRDCFKCFALGADYVMMGSTFSKLSDSSAKTEIYNDKVVKLYYGMASEYGQKMLGKEKLSASEGKVVYLTPVNKYISDYAKDFQNYLMSCMSYCGKSNFLDFVGNVNLIVVSPNAYNQFNK